MMMVAATIAGFGVWQQCRQVMTMKMAVLEGQAVIASMVRVVRNIMAMMAAGSSNGNGIDDCSKR